jgi:hypothetical protein
MDCATTKKRGRGRGGLGISRRKRRLRIGREKEKDYWLPQKKKKKITDCPTTRRLLIAQQEGDDSWLPNKKEKIPDCPTRRGRRLRIAQQGLSLQTWNEGKDACVSAAGRMRRRAMESALRKKWRTWSWEIGRVKS